MDSNYLERQRLPRSAGSCPIAENLGRYLCIGNETDCLVQENLLAVVSEIKTLAFQVLKNRAAAGFDSNDAIDKGSFGFLRTGWSASKGSCILNSLAELRHDRARLAFCC